MVDITYARGWDDCLEAVMKILNSSTNVEEVKKKLEKLHSLVKDNKFEKIRYELGVYDLF